MKEAAIVSKNIKNVCHMKSFIFIASASLQTSQFHLNLAPSGQRSMFGQIFDVRAVRLKFAVSSHFLKNFTIPFGETPLLGNVDLEDK